MNRQQVLCLAAIALAMLSVCAGQKPAGCNNPGCICEGKPDGNYPLEFQVKDVEFVICKGGKSGPGHCPGNAPFDKEKKTCAGGAQPVDEPVAPVVTPGAQGGPQGQPQDMPAQSQGVPQGGPRQGFEAYQGAYRQGYEDAMEEEYNPTKSGFGDTGSFKGCLIKPQGRGVGTIPDGCAPNQFRSGLLCYPNCRSGYTGVGPVCWENCANGAKDIGAICSRPAQVIGANCNCPWYDKCGLTFARGCCSCPSDFTWTGCTCGKGDTSYAKKSYGNGAGFPSTGCTNGKVMDAGLCYPPCPGGTKGVGPMCWLDSTRVPTGYPVKCDVGVSVNAYYADTVATCQAIASALNKITISTGTSGAACALAILATIPTFGIAAPAAAVGCSTAIGTAQLNNIPEYTKLAALPVCP